MNTEKISDLLKDLDHNCNFLLEKESNEKIVEFVAYFMVNHDIYINNFFLIPSILSSLNIENWRKIIKLSGEEEAPCVYTLLGFIFTYCFIDKKFLKSVGFSEKELNERLNGMSKTRKMHANKYNKLLIKSCLDKRIGRDEAISIYNIFTEKKDKTPPAYILNELELSHGNVTAR